MSTPIYIGGKHKIKKTKTPRSTETLRVRTGFRKEWQATPYFFFYKKNVYIQNFTITYTVDYSIFNIIFHLVGV